VVEEEEIEEEPTEEEEEEITEEIVEEEQTEGEVPTYETEVKQVAGVTEYSELKVRVKDDQGNPLANTLVKMGNQSQMTDLEGIATFRDIRAGEYTLEYEYDGKKAIKSISIENIDVQDGEKIVLNVIDVEPEGESGTPRIFLYIIIGILFLVVLIFFVKLRSRAYTNE
jgi:uncharacterized membrane protein